MKALILAAGYATRLYPLTKEYPKSLLEVNGKPIIDYIIDKLNGLCDIDKVAVVTNTKFFPIFKDWSKSLKTGKGIIIIDDLTKNNETRRGAIGDIAFAINKLKVRDDLLVIGGDNLFDGGLDGFCAFAAKKKAPVIGVYDIKQKKNASKYGVIKLDKNKRIVDFQEKPARPNSSLVGMCLYYFPKNKTRLIKSYLGLKSKKNDATGFYIDWLRKKAPVYGYVFRGKWFDIGDFKYYNKAKEVFAD